jgi:hypothetical protein
MENKIEGTPTFEELMNNKYRFNEKAQ